MLRAIQAKTGKPVEIGDEITDFRGDKAILVSVDRVRTLGRSGLITYKLPDGKSGRCVYDKVYDIIVIETGENASTLNAEPNEPRQINSLKERGL